MSPKQESQHKSEISVNFSVYAYISKNLQMESNTLGSRIINYNQLVCEATMCLECCPVFGRWVEFSCITMSLIIDIINKQNTNSIPSQIGGHSAASLSTEETNKIISCQHQC